MFGVGIAKSGMNTLGRCFREFGYRNRSIRDALVLAAVGAPAAVIAATWDFDGFEDFPWFWSMRRSASAILTPLRSHEAPMRRDHRSRKSTMGSDYQRFDSPHLDYALWDCPFDKSIKLRGPPVDRTRP